jgi:hypothetical protein
MYTVSGKPIFHEDKRTLYDHIFLILRPLYNWFIFSMKIQGKRESGIDIV